MADDGSKLPLDRIVDGIRELVERHSRRAEISRQLNKSPNWLSRVLLGELKLDFNRAEKVLQQIDVPFGWFLTWCFEADQGPPPSRVLDLLTGSRTEPASLVADLRPTLDEILRNADQAAATDSGFFQEELLAIEELRFKNREAARLEVERFVVRLVNSETAPARVAELCRALCIWASIQRTSQRPELASVALCWSLRATECLGLRITSAHLRQRSSYLLRDTGHPVQAKTMLESSILDFVQAGSWSDVARCLVDRACLDLQLSRPDQAERNASAALRMLEPAQWRNLAIAHQVLAECALTRNDTGGALGHLDNAVDAHRDRRDEVLFGHLLWSRARLHSELGNDDAAITDCHQALDLIAKNGMPLDVALIALQLAQSLLRLGKTREICALAEQVQGMTPLFRGAPLVDGVLMEFVRIVRYDSLSMVFLSRCLERIQVGGPEDPP